MRAASRLLLVQGDTVLRDVLVEQLASVSNLDVVACGDGDAGRSTLGREPFDIVLTEMSLPDMDGGDFIAAIRQDGFRGPIVAISSTSEEPDREPAARASEIVTKPFRFAVLLSRIRSQLRGHEASEEAVAIAIGPYTFHAGAKTLTSAVNGLLRLTEKEAAILRFLHRAGDSTVSRETLLQEVWGYNPAVTTHTLETHIYRLRQKIEVDPSEARILVTEPGGYRLMP
jgi:DNA-binding response OmpR family regulator